jgi:DNA-binding transcriptional ArsR family regulator
LPVSPADRLLEAVAEPVAVQIVRALASTAQTQVALVGHLGLGQSVVSRATKTLRTAGVIESVTPRGELRLRAADETRSLLLAVDRLAEALLADDAERQRLTSAQTRRSQIRRTDSEADDAGALDVIGGSSGRRSARRDTSDD